MKGDACFRVNRPHVVHDVIDGEAVLINLKNGQYYSTDKAGADVWCFVEKGSAFSEIVGQILGRYRGSRKDIEKGVSDLLAELQKEELIAPGREPTPSKQSGLRADANGTVGEKPLFEPPHLQKYSDMEDLLMLDPIHDVDESGWPNLPVDEN